MQLLPSEQSSFPPIEIYKKNHKFLLDYNYSNYNFEAINNLYFNKAIILPSAKERLDPRAFDDFMFYRVRKNIDFSKTDLNLANTFSYPPPNVCKQNGRSNVARTSVFYCSDSPVSAMHEMNLQLEDVGFLSAWKIETSRPIKIGCLLPRNLKPINPWNKFNKDVHDDQIKLWSKHYPDLIEHYNMLTEFIGKAYRLKDSGYHLSSFISKKLMFQDIYNDFLLYPSISTDETYSNMAFHPNFVDENLKLYKVIQFKVGKIIEAKPTFSIGKVGELFNGKMKWRRKNIQDYDVLDSFSKPNLK